MTLTYERVIELLPAYAIGALDDDDQNAVDEYFKQVESIRSRLTDLEQATTLLAQEADEAEMAADAKQRLMARVQADAPDVHQATHGEDILTHTSDAMVNGADKSARMAAKVSPYGGRSPDPANASTATPKRQQRSRQSHTATRRSTKPQQSGAEPESGSASFWQSLGELINGRALVNAGLVASVAATVLLAALAGGLDRQVRSLQVRQNENQQVFAQASERFSILESENEMLAAANDEIQAELSELQIIFDETDAERAALYAEYQRLQGELAANNERITLVGAASQATVMFGTNEAPGLQGTFFHKGEEGALVVHGLEPLPIDQTYQFWLVTENGEQVSAGLFLVDENAEPTWATLALPQEAPEYVVVGVTIEPATGSPFPTGPMLLESPAEQGISF